MYTQFIVYKPITDIAKGVNHQVRTQVPLSTYVCVVGGNKC